MCAYYKENPILSGFTIKYIENNCMNTKASWIGHVFSKEIQSVCTLSHNWVYSKKASFLRFVSPYEYLFGDCPLVMAFFSVPKVAALDGVHYITEILKECQSYYNIHYFLKQAKGYYCNDPRLMNFKDDTNMNRTPWT